MKICDLTQSYAATSGGVKTYLHAKQEYIRYTDHHHVLIVPGESDSVRCEGNLTTYTIRSLPVPHCDPYRFTMRLDKVIRILKREKPDIVELGDAYLLPQAGFACKRQLGSALVGFYHTDFPTAYVEPVIRERLGPLAARQAREWSEAYARRIYSRCDVTITCSNTFKTRLKSIGIDNVRRISLGVDTETFHPNKRDRVLRHGLGIGSDEICMIYTGRLDSEKRADLLVDAFMRVTDRFPGKLIMMGEGVHRANIEAQSRLHEKIIYLPYENDRNRLARYMASADVYVTAGPHETFGLSVIEAQASGLCVLGVEAGALRDRVLPGTGLLCSPDSVEALSRAMLKICREDCHAMGREGRRLIENHYSWDRTFDHLFDIYQDIHEAGSILHRKIA